MEGRTKFHIVITERALHELRAIHGYIEYELFEPETADRQLERIVDAIDRLSYTPRRNALVRDESLAQRQIRREIVGNYSIFYTVEERSRKVYIVSILYGRRDYDKLL